MKQADLDNRSRQLNPQHPTYESSRGAQTAVEPTPKRQNESQGTTEETTSAEGVVRK